MATAEHLPVEPPYRAGAPNVVVIVLDDVGFGLLGAYGSDLDTPAIDGLAQRGVRLTNFHTTAICSPTRACLLTGRNHHRVGMGMLPDLPASFPGYTGEFPKEAGTLAHILQDEGYATFCVGKWHLVPRDQRAVGPFGMWPSEQGFDRYYGFLNGETNQWTPNLVRDHTHIEPPATPEEGYHLDVDLADQAITYLRELRAASPDRPFLLWYATAAAHAPHQAPPEWLDQYRGRFDGGWDAWREATLERQKRLGIVGPETELPDRPAWVEPWDQIDEPRRQLYARMMEACAGFLSHADHHIGRVLDHLASVGELDNTYVVLVSDNGASAEGGPHGSYNQLGHYISDDEDDIDDELAHLSELGGFRSSGHYPWGWALAANTPLRRWKRYTFEGGVRDPFIITGPGLAAGELRHQYAHAVDVLPTLLDLMGVPVPSSLGGVQQMSLDGVSLAPLLSPGSSAPEVRTTQYYECWGSRAIYHEGWKAVTNHVNQLTAAERKALDGSHDFACDRWALFDTRTDFNERHDLAAAEPERLASLIGLWHELAEANQVFPLDDSAAHRIAHLRLPWQMSAAEPVYRPGDKVHEVNAPMLAGGYRVSCLFSSPLGDAAASGVLCEQGDWIAGWALFLSEGDLYWALAGKSGASVVRAPVPAAAQVLSADVVVGTGSDGAASLEVTLRADDQVIGSSEVAGTIPLTWAPDGAFLTIGYGRPFPVVDDYKPPAPAPSSLAEVRFTTGPLPEIDVDEELARLMRHQ
jgi:arylsulfatase